MTDQPDLAIVIKDPPTFAFSPRLVLMIVIRELPLTPFLGICGLSIVMLELRLRPPGRLLMLSASGGAERPQPGRRLDLIGALVGHHDRDGQRSRGERRDGDFL